MARQTLKDRVAALLAEGRTVGEIAGLVDRTKPEVHQIRAKLRAERNRALGVTADHLAREGYGYQDISVDLDIPEADAHEAVFNAGSLERKAS
jgi:hypothetical protein